MLSPYRARKTAPPLFWSGVLFLFLWIFTHDQLLVKTIQKNQNRKMQIKIEESLGVQGGVKNIQKYN